MTEVTHEHAGWIGRPGASRVLRTLIFVAPLAAGVGVSALIAAALASPRSLTEWIMWFVALAAASTVVMYTVDHLARRLLPLAALLKLSLIFPDDAPSRFSIALRSGDMRQIEAKVEVARRQGITGTATEAAESLLVLMAVLSEHDRATRGHGERVRAYAAMIGEEMGLSPLELSKLQWAALAHDVGKLAVSAEILNKPGRLTDEEFEVIKTHPAEGMKLVEPMREWLGEWVYAVGQHHERIDGSGYPEGLSGNDITLGARIVSVADVYDVITATRSYKRAQSAEVARRELQRCAGTQFDAEVVRAFLNVSLGRQKRSFWALSWIAHVPILGPIAAAPAVNVVGAAALGLGAVTGGMTIGGNEMLSIPMSIAFADSPVDDLAIISDLTGPAEPQVVISTDRADRTDSTDSIMPSVPTARAAPTTTRPTFAAAPTTGVGPTTTVAPNAALPMSTTTVPVTTTTVGPAPTVLMPTTTVPITTVTTILAPTTTAAPPAGPIGPCELVANGETELSGLDLTACSFRSFSLTGVDFTNANLSGVDFGGARIEDSVFDGAILTDTDFGSSLLLDTSLDGASMAGASLRRAVVLGSSFAGADLSSVDSRQAWFEDVDIAAASLVSGNFRQSVFIDVDFSDVNAATATFKQASIIESDLTDANFSGVNLQDASFSEVDFSGMDFTGATGAPTGTASSTFSATICPSGVLTNTGCW